MRIKQKRDEENQVEVTMMSSSKLANSSKTKMIKHDK